MKQYKVVLVDLDGETSADVIDLVNVSNDADRIMADPDSFYVGDIVTEDQFYLKEVPIVNEQSYYRGILAFKK